MNQHVIADAVGYLEADLLREHLERKAQLRGTPNSRRAKRVIKWTAAAAACVCVLCGTGLLLPFVPTRYELDYSYGGSNGEETFVLDKNLWIYYVDPTTPSRIKKERVTLPCNADNVFMTWKHLNQVGDDVLLLNYEILSDHRVDSTDFQGESVVHNEIGSYFILSMTISAELKNYENYDALLSSLKQTMTDYLNIDIDVTYIHFE